MFSVEFNVHTANEHTIRAIARELESMTVRELRMLRAQLRETRNEREQRERDALATRISGFDIQDVRMFSKIADALADCDQFDFSETSERVALEIEL